MKSAIVLGSLVAAIEAATCDSPVQRKNFLSLSDEDKTAYTDAVLCLTTHDAVFGLYDGATTLWDEQQYLHLTMSNYIHGVVSHKSSK
jgi:tyrosinase